MWLKGRGMMCMVEGKGSLPCVADREVRASLYGRRWARDVVYG